MLAFDRYDVVGIDAAHDNKLLDDFILSLIRHPQLPEKVNDVVVECGNRRYQSLLDRYIAGDDVPLTEVQAVWRNTTVLMCGLSAFYRELFPLVREINQRLPSGRRLRVVAADPPVDWSSGDPSSNRRAVPARDASIAQVMTTEVLQKKRKALMLFGTGHLLHNERSGGSAVTTYERTNPGRTYVVDAYIGFGALIDQPRGRLLERRMAAWPKPSLIPVKGTWLADLDLHYFSWPFLPRMAGMEWADLVDGFLYFGPADSLVYEKTPDAVLNDQAYMAELKRRFDLDASELRRRNANPALLTRADRQWALSAAKGAEFVGVYAAKQGDRPVVEIDFRKGTLSAKLSDGSEWIGLSAVSGSTRFRIERAARDEYLAFEAVGGGDVRLTVQSPHEPKPTILVRLNEF